MVHPDYWRPFGLRSADRIHPEWQNISVGHRMLANPKGSAWWEVAALEPERFLGLRMTVDLLGRRFDRPKWLQGILGFLFLEPSTWIMQTRQFAGIKRRAEREARHPSTLATTGA